MSYQLENPQRDVLNNRKDKLFKDKAVAEKVRSTINTPGWKDILGPLLDRMIIDVIGGKIKGKWVSGALENARKDERREYYIGFKQGLMQYHSHIMNYISQIARIEGEIEDIEKQLKAEFVTPMLEKEVK